MMKNYKQVWVLNMYDPETNISMVSGVYDNEQAAERVAEHERQQNRDYGYRVVPSTLWEWSGVSAGIGEAAES
jgi:hypothetical protein